MTPTPIPEIVELFKTPDRRAFITAKIDGSYVTLPVKSKEVKLIISQIKYHETGKWLPSFAIKEFVEELEMRALCTGPTRTVNTRVAEYNGCIYVNMGDAQGHSIEITPAGWDVVIQPEVKFWLPNGLPMERPQRGGDVQMLRKFLNLRSAEDFLLIWAWLLQAWFSKGAYPLLILLGQHGTAKSTTARILKRIVDPSTVELRSLSTSIRDFMISAAANWALSFNNVSTIKDWQSDVLATLSTGGGFSTRVLYSDDEEKLFSPTLPVILNGITNFVDRSDLADRVISIELPRIPEDKRRTEEDLFGEFEQELPYILGALCDIVSTCLKNLSRINPPHLPRMADFAKRVIAAESALPSCPGGFIAAYEKNRLEIVDNALYADPLAKAVIALMSTTDQWQGTATKLQSTLEAMVSEQVKKLRSWPRENHVLSKRLKRLAPFLHESGFDVEFSREGRVGTRVITIKKVALLSSALSERLLPRPDGAGEPTLPEIADGSKPSGGISESQSCDEPALHADATDERGTIQ